MNHLVDTHAHLLKQYYGSNIKNIINKSITNYVERIINISINEDSIKEVVNITKEHDIVFGALGIHPQEALKIKKNPKELFENYLKNLKIVAIGEIGFDFYRENSTKLKNKQFEIFHLQMNLAIKYNLPVIIHSRSATETTFNELKKYPEVKKVIHCFSENVSVMKKYLTIPNTWISFTGIVTFKNAQDVQESFKACPIEKIMLETDCPYLAPTPYRGKTNEPAYVKNICEYACKLKEITFNELMEITTMNSYKFFKKLY